MSDELLGDRRRALEEEFFRKQDDALVSRLRAERQRKVTKEALADASGIRDGAVLDALVSLGIEPSTLAAFALVPLVEVAWADGRLDRRERDAILTAAEEKGLKAGSAARQLVQNWIDSPSAPSLMRAWVDYTRLLCAKLPKDKRESLAKEVVGRARSVALAAGGLLGLGAVSTEEQEVLRLLEAAFTD